MDYVLRQGETFTRWWTPQGGRWNHRLEWNREAWLRQLIEQPPRGPKPNHRDFTIHNHGNGRFVYRPDLSDRSSDFADGAYDARNVRPAAAGLTLKEPGEGYAIFEVRSPYVIVPKVGPLDTLAGDREAAQVELAASGASLAHFVGQRPDVARPARPGRRRAVGLDPARRRPLRLPVEDRASRAAGPGPCPRAGRDHLGAGCPGFPARPGQGHNRMEYRTGDHYGLKTRVLEIRSEAGKPEETLKYLAAPPADYDPARKTDRIHGPAVVKLQAPPGTKIAWLTAEGAFSTHQGQAARNTRNTISYAVDKPEAFHEIYRAEVPTDTAHWHTNAHREIRLDRPAERVYVRYVGDPALNNFHLYAHCLDDGRGVGPAGDDHSSLARVRRPQDAARSRSRSRAPTKWPLTPSRSASPIEIAVPSDTAAEKKGPY